VIGVPGNSQRKGAVRRSGKGNTAGSGGRVRRGLEGKGPTPKAEDRPYHPAYRAKRSAARRTPEKARPARTGRPGTGPEWVAGPNAVLEALQAEIPIKTAYVADGAERDDRLRDILKLAANRSLPLLEVARIQLDRLTGGAVHQGVALQLPAYDYAHPDDLLATALDADAPALLVALDSITDPRNLGAVVRSAAAFGAHGVLIPERRAAGMTAAAWKTSAGAAARLSIARATNLNRTLRSYADAGCTLVGLDGSAPTRLSDLDLTGPLVLVVGSEGEGLSRLVRETCDQLAAIPIADEVESLNAGVAAGIALYEIAQARRPSVP
jgi:23S rRNA (guanosine2251-2'-O)-methyltransferase